MSGTPIEWRKHTPHSTHYDDVYYSVDDGLAESRYVFLGGNNLSQRLAALSEPQFTVLETGFGTGLNFAALAQLWRQHPPATGTLRFISIEKHPLNRDQIAKALHHWPELAEITNALCEQWPPAIPGWHRLVFAQHRFELVLIFDDVFNALDQLQATDIRADAVFLDGFAPAKNPAMWREAVLTKIAACTHEHGTLATFTAVGQVRRDLQAAGFTIRKTPGFGRKREMLVGTKHSPAESTRAWYKTATLPVVNNCAVVGAGIAGCHIAHRLAAQGVKVTLYDSAADVASGASGNPQGIVFNKLSAKTGELAEFSLAAYLHAQRFYQQLRREDPHSGSVNQSGMLTLCQPEQWQQLRDKFITFNGFIDFLTAEEASVKAGQTVSLPALWFVEGLWIDPPMLCQQLVNSPHITFVGAQRIAAIKQQDSGKWQLQNEAGNTFTHDAVVIASSVDSRALVNDYALPIRPAGGQITAFTQDQANAPNCIVCGAAYAAPLAATGNFTIGATYAMNQQLNEPTTANDEENINKLTSALPQFSASAVATQRASTRAASNDYLPLAGALPNVAAFGEAFKALSHNAKTLIDENAPVQQHLYLLSGLGSRGLSYAPLCADIICDQLLGLPVLHSAALQAQIQPARFLVRALKRNTFNQLTLT